MRAKRHFKGYHKWETSEEVKYVQELLKGIKREVKEPTWYQRILSDSQRRGIEYYVIKIITIMQISIIIKCHHD